MRLKIGRVPVDVITFDEAVEAIAELHHGTVFTPNVDHIVLAERNPRLAEAYARSTLSLADGFPLVAVSKLTSTPLPEKISGSDLLPALMREWGRRGRAVYLVGPSEAVARKAIPHFYRAGMRVLGVNTCQFPTEPDEHKLFWLKHQIQRSQASVVLWSLGAPKQELWADRMKGFCRDAVHVCTGAALEFHIGAAKRAPKWVSSVGLEWAHRFAQDPKRLGPRYLRDAIHFPRVALGSLLKRTG